MSLFLYFALPLALTVVAEGAVMALLFRQRRLVYYSLLCNLATNPALNLALLLIVNFVGQIWYWPALAALEALALLAEAWAYVLLGFPCKRALWVSALLNAASFGTGLIFFSLFSG